MAALSKKDYLPIRTNLIIGNLPMSFLEKWCNEEDRRFDILLKIFEIGNRFGFSGFLLKCMVDYFDCKYKIIIIYETDGRIIDIY